MQTQKPENARQMAQSPDFSIPQELPQQSPTPETPPSVEQTPDKARQVSTPEMTELQIEKEQPPEHDSEKGFLTKAISEVRNKLSRKPVQTKQVTLPIVKDEMTKEIESIMSDGLGEAFQALTPVEQQEFKLKGEQAALEVRALMDSTKLKVKNVFLIVLKWLSFLPGINKFYLEQEAKIKADKIMALHQIRKR